jgi:hypothetical protein
VLPVHEEEDEGVSTQVPPFLHGEELHQERAIEPQTGPEKPRGQEHEKDAILSVQLAPFEQGLEEHSLMLV